MIEENYWPPDEAFLDISDVEQLTDGRARCTSVAICDEKGVPAMVFHQGEEAHFFFEFEILAAIGVPSGGLEFHDSTQMVIHGKTSFQFDGVMPDEVPKCKKLRYHYAVKLTVAPGQYWFTVGCASTNKETYCRLKAGSLTHEKSSSQIFEHCRAKDAGSFFVKFMPDGNLLHHGIADLPGKMNAITLDCPSLASRPANVLNEPTSGRPTIIHVTHWKAGSQWIYKILSACAPDLIVPPQSGQEQFRYWALQTGKVYPTVYVTKKEFDAMRLPKNCRHFVVIRDLRDTLISSYFSFKISHPILGADMDNLRTTLNLLGLENGLLHMMDESLPINAKIQLSWQEAGEKLIRYEDLLEHDLEILEPLLIDYCELPISRERLREIIIENRFESLTKGRKRGEQDINAHERKGISGDWKNYFTEKVKKAFKARYGGLLVATGYERDLNW